MADKDPGRDRASGQKDNSSSVRDALMAKVQAREKADAAAGKVDRGLAASLGTPADDSPLQQPISFGQPNNLQRAVFCRQFATLIEIGIPVLKALQMLALRTSQGKLRKAIQAAAQGVEEGQPIHQAMARHTRTFTSVVINIVKIGETGGILESSLIRLAEIMESKARIKRRIVSAMMYPLVALAVAVGVVMVIMVRAIPTFAEVYRDTGSELPTSTQIIIRLSEFLVGSWWLVIIAIVAGLVGLSMWGRTPSGHRVYSWIALRVPVLKTINQKIAVARSTRALGGLVTAGIPLIESLAITSDTNENALVSDAFQAVHDQVERGERMTAPLRKANVFPTLVVDMISIGEETGTLDRMLEKVADIYDVEVDATLSGLSSIIEPLLIVVLGGVVMFIALAVLLPYFNMVQVVES
jgi:type IV pilus assembly protein PilC